MEIELEFAHHENIVQIRSKRRTALDLRSGQIEDYYIFVNNVHRPDLEFIGSFEEQEKGIRDALDEERNCAA